MLTVSVRAARLLKLPAEPPLCGKRAAYCSKYHENTSCAMITIPLIHGLISCLTFESN